MRLKNVYIIIKNNIGTINSIRSNLLANYNPQQFSIDSWDKSLPVLIELSEIESLKDTISSILNISPQLTSHQTSIRLTSDQNSSVFNSLKILKDKMTAIIELCNTMEFDENPNGFDIKMPISRDFNEFANNILLLKRFFQTCPFIKKQETEIEFSRTDVGSFWLQFSIIGAGVAGVLTSLAKVAQEALKVKSLYLTCEMQKQSLRTITAKNDLLERITNLYNDMIEESINGSIESLQQEEQQLDSEGKESARQSLKVLGTLMSKGLEIYSAIEAPKEIQTLFPTIAEQKKLEAPKKQLSESAESLLNEDDSRDSD